MKRCAGFHLILNCLIIAAIYYTPVVYYPAAKPTARVSQATLDQVRGYLDQQLKNAVAQRKTLVNQSGPGTLIMKTAITAVKAENQDMRFYEVVPVAAVIASTMAASGHRTQNSVLFLETQLLDAKNRQAGDGSGSQGLRENRA